MKKVLILSTIITCLSSSSTHATEQNEATKMTNTEYLRSVINNADRGDVEAQLFLGEIFEGPSQLTEANLKKSFTYFLMAANQGDRAAQSVIGGKYEKGEGVEKDLEKAFSYFKMAADQGCTNSQFVVAGKYHDGEGVNKDIKEAFIYYKLAADQGDQRALQCLGTHLL